MKSVRNTIIGFVAGTLLMFGSCINLDEHPWNDITDGAVDPSNPSIINDLMGEVYNAMGTFYMSYEAYWDLEEVTDLYMQPTRLSGDFPAYSFSHKHVWYQNIGPAISTYNACMVGIQYACKCLDLLPESLVKERAKMRFFRAFYYYIIFDLFRNPPFMTTMDFDPGWMPVQIGPEALFDWIVAELVAVKEDLGTEKIFGYPNRWVAAMTLAKMYLNRNAWFRTYSNVNTNDNSWYEKALAEVEDVINTGGYSLSPKYFDNVMADLRTNTEIIFGIAFDYVQDSYYGNYLINKCHVVAGRYIYGYTGNTPWNRTCGIPQFIKTYDPDDKRLDDSWVGGICHYYTVAGGRNSGDPIPFTGDDWSGTGFLNYNIEVHSADNPGAYQQEGYRFQKMECIPGAVGTYGNDVPFYRLGDAMFIKAECLLRLGRDKQVAADLITEVRMRSFDNSTKATRTVADLEGGSVYNYGQRECTSEGFNNWTNWIDIPEGGADIILGGLLDDLAWEFLGEHHRRQDLIRFEMTNGISVFSGKSWFSKKAHPNEQWREYFGLSGGWLTANINLRQNPGYPDIQR